MRMMEEQYVAILIRSDPSFKVFDFTRVQRRSYYSPINAQTTSATTNATAVSIEAKPPLKIGPAPLGLPSRPATPSDRTGVVSRTGLDVEAQILDGGGMANMGGRGGWRTSELDAGSRLGLGIASRESIEMGLTNSRGSGYGASPNRKATPLRTSST